jgi:hypothetical protein
VCVVGGGGGGGGGSVVVVVGGGGGGSVVVGGGGGSVVVVGGGGGSVGSVTCITNAKSCTGIAHFVDTGWRAAAVASRGSFVVDPGVVEPGGAACDFFVRARGCVVDARSCGALVGVANEFAKNVVPRRLALR